VTSKGLLNNYSRAALPNPANDCQDLVTRASLPLTELGTIPNPFTPVLVAPAVADPRDHAEDLPKASCCTNPERAIAALLEEIALKDLE
jgi:hypothetical protein